MRNVGDPKQSIAWAELSKRKTELEAGKKALLLQYREKHPDVIIVQSQIDSIEKQMSDMVKETKERVAEVQKRLERQIDPRVNSIKYNLTYLNSEMTRQERQLASAEAQIANIEGHLGEVPEVEVGLESINREYNMVRGAYEGMLRQSEQAKLGSEIILNQQGESIGVIDSANLPEQPVAPKRPMLVVLGLFAGLGVGLAFAAAFEVPKLLTVQTREDAEHYTGLPVLVTLPEMLTPREVRRLKARRLSLAVAGVIVAILSVPALAFVLTRLHLIEMIAMRG